jgi:hypothetical protein
MSTRVAIALGVMAILGLLVARLDGRQERVRPKAQLAPEPSERRETGPRDDFDVLIQALDAGACDWISAPVPLGNRLAVTTGNGTTHRYTFSPTDDRLTQLRQAVARNHVLAPQGTRAR